MKSVEQINRELYRPLKKGSQFNKYFSTSQCTPVHLGKGATKVVLKEIAKWAKKYSAQTHSLSKNEFAHLPIGQVPNAIHKFLFHHIQYKIDAKTQYLKSPNCAWHSKNDGMDCKSYTVFASSILLNLGIIHQIRRVKQPYHYPNAFTHVYVVVPNNQKSGSLNQGYQVIEGTLPSNQEVTFIEKDDIIMNEPALDIIGLAAPVDGCSCEHNKQDSTFIQPDFNKIGKELPTVTDNFMVSWNRFESFLKVIGSFSESSDPINKLRGSVFHYLQKGEVPTVKTSKCGVQIGKYYIDLNDISTKMKTGQSLGFPSSVLASMLTQIDKDGLASKQTPAKKPFDIAGITSIFSNLLGGGFIENIIGPVFSEGFDCWGSSWSKARANREFNTAKSNFDQVFQQAAMLNGAALVQAFNKAIWDFAQYYLKEVTYQMSGKPKGCTKRGIDMYVETMNKLLQEYIAFSNQTMLGKNVLFSASTTTMVDNKGNYRGQIEVPQIVFEGVKQFNVFTNNNDGFTDLVKPGSQNINDKPRVDKPRTSNAGAWIFGLLAVGGIVYGTQYNN